MKDYAAFLRAKTQMGADSGFEPAFMPGFLFDFQAAIVEWAVRKGRAAIFADCGLGKTPMGLTSAANRESRSARTSSSMYWKSRRSTSAGTSGSGSVTQPPPTGP